jgi:hypothetical protein
MSVSLMLIDALLFPNGTAIATIHRHGRSDRGHWAGSVDRKSLPDGSEPKAMLEGRKPHFVIAPTYLFPLCLLRP